MIYLEFNATLVVKPIGKSLQGSFYFDTDFLPIKYWRLVFWIYFHGQNNKKYTRFMNENKSIFLLMHSKLRRRRRQKSSNFLDQDIIINGPSTF